jgi:hypothetical protein
MRVVPSKQFAKIYIHTQGFTCKRGFFYPGHPVSNLRKFIYTLIGLNPVHTCKIGKSCLPGSEYKFSQISDEDSIVCVRILIKFTYVRQNNVCTLPLRNIPKFAFISIQFLYLYKKFSILSNCENSI